MTGSTERPSLAALKTQAKRLRSHLQHDGTSISHSQALEVLAHQHGYRDWNTLYAAAGNHPALPVVVGQPVTGRYLGHPFDGEVTGLRVISDTTDRYRLTVVFDEPVDVVTFDSFSAFRKRVSCTINGDGVTAERTSDGTPHLALDLARS